MSEQTFTSVSLIPRPPARTYGQRPRCRVCGAVCGVNNRRSICDRFCPGHGNPGDRAVLPVVAWASGAAFEWRG